MTSKAGLGAKGAIFFKLALDISRILWYKLAAIVYHCWYGGCYE
jgi:hypothetical protein